MVEAEVVVAAPARWVAAAVVVAVEWGAACSRTRVRPLSNEIQQNGRFGAHLDLWRPEFHRLLRMITATPAKISKAPIATLAFSSVLRNSRYANNATNIG